MCVCVSVSMCSQYLMRSKIEKVNLFFATADPLMTSP